MNALEAALNMAEDKLTTAGGLSERDMKLVKIAVANALGAKEMLRISIIQAKQAGIGNAEIEQISQLIPLLRARVLLESPLAPIAPGQATAQASASQECCR
ncbi:hypothetical protein ACFSQE_18240 [Vogesella fluminis]|uniref:Carboxymuconolactone decarboxylase-like domain-containing protein n=1 Tax=Vogesella fluminis TaxID=1069161 RepID=A0ABQ3HGP4_9NEIS|nr:hypothetical protein [Vogesella fluminis]GHD81879.1 hypothetical protein GCM10011419_28620 [Vogesella fluminis]